MTGLGRKIALVCLTAMAVPCLQAEDPSAAKTVAAGGAIKFVTHLTVSDTDRVILEAFIKHAVEYAEKLTAEKVATRCKAAPEMFAWVEFRYLNCLNVAYELTGDTQYLELFRNRFLLFRNIMTAGRDKYLGWYGLALESRRPKDNPTLRIDELQMNFRAISILARWVELARTDRDYAARHAGTIKAYLILMTRHLYPKWDARGHFVEVPGRGGVYRGLDYPIPVLGTLSFEKLSIMVDGLLKLHRVTGDEQYLKRALQVGAWFKSNLMLKDGHYEWMSWAPAGKWDVHPTKEDAWRIGWIAPDPNGGWYVASLSIALNLYQHGLAFDETDLKRFIKTQRTMCWNGDMAKPEYRTVAGATSKWVTGRFLSYQLAHYDGTLRKLAFAGPHEPEAVKSAASSWKGGANAQSYVREKYLMRSVIPKLPQPHAPIGRKFLANAPNKKFHDAILPKVKSPGAPPPGKPSQTLK